MPFTRCENSRWMPLHLRQTKESKGTHAYWGSLSGQSAQTCEGGRTAARQPSDATGTARQARRRQARRRRRRRRDQRERDSVARERRRTARRSAEDRRHRAGFAEGCAPWPPRRLFLPARRRGTYLVVRLPRDLMEPRLGLRLGLGPAAASGASAHRDALLAVSVRFPARPGPAARKTQQTRPGPHASELFAPPRPLPRTPPPPVPPEGRPAAHRQARRAVSQPRPPTHRITEDSRCRLVRGAPRGTTRPPQSGGARPRRERQAPRPPIGQRAARGGGRDVGGVPAPGSAGDRYPRSTPRRRLSHQVDPFGSLVAGGSSVLCPASITVRWPPGDGRGLRRCSVL